VTHKFAKYLILAAGALSLSALPALATTCGGDLIVTSGTTCTLGALSFDFDTVSFDPAASADSLELTTGTGISGDDYTLDFQVTPDGATDLLLEYTVTSLAPVITGVDNSYLSNGSSPADQSLDEEVCTNSTCDDELMVLDNTTGGLQYSSPFAAQSSIFIEKDFAFPSSFFTDSVVATPEPSSIGFMLIGALGIALVSRKFRRA